MLKNKKCQALLIAASAFIGIEGNVYGSNWRMSDRAFNRYERAKHILYGGSHVATRHTAEKKHDYSRVMPISSNSNMYDDNIRDIISRYQETHKKLSEAIEKFNTKSQKFFDDDVKKSYEEWSESVEKPYYDAVSSAFVGAKAMLKAHNGEDINRISSLALSSNYSHTENKLASLVNNTEITINKISDILENKKSLSCSCDVLRDIRFVSSEN